MTIIKDQQYQTKINYGTIIVINVTTNSIPKKIIFKNYMKEFMM